MTPPVSPLTRSESRGAAAETPAASLTPREWQVLRHLATGRTYQQAAGDLGISYQTVKNHVSRAYAKLDVGGLVDAFQRVGLLTAAPLIEWHVTDGAEIRA